MDHFVFDSTPKGSAILAYGRSRGPWWNKKLLALIAGSFVVVAVAVFFIMSTQLTLPLPTDRLALLSTTPKQAFSALSTDLRQSLPPTWRAAIETHSSHAAYLGVMLDADGRAHTFALVLRTNVVVPTETVHVTNDGAYRLLTDGSSMNIERVPIAVAWSLSRRLRQHDVSFVVSGRLLSRLAFSETETNDDVTGVWDGTQGTLNIASTMSSGGAAIDAPIFSRLGDDHDVSRPAVAALTSQGIDLRAMTTSPDELSVRPDTDGVVISWQNDLKRDDLVSLRASLGVFDRQELMLPDETGVLELLPSSATATDDLFLIPAGLGSTSTWELTTTSLTPSSWNPQELQADAACTGQVRFLLQDNALQNVLTSWNVPISWKNTLRRIQIVDSGQTVRVCVN